MLTLAIVGLLLTADRAGAPLRQQPSLSQLIGQHLLVRMEGSTPSASFLASVRRGEVGGVVLFRNNIPPSGPGRLIARLQSAARSGGQLPLLIAIDQEGGVVKRLPGPPTFAPSAMTSPSVARAQGVATGRYLHRLGVGIDLAPVLDVPASSRSFIAGRAFSSSSAVVSSRGVAFGVGLIRGGVAAAAKHFPGLGRLVQNTDFGVGRIGASRNALDRDLAPFRAAVGAGVPVILVGTAIYRAYGSDLPAACVPAIVDGLLRRTLGFRGVTLSDDLGTEGVSTRVPPLRAVVLAVQAGIDMVYIAGSSGTGSDTIAHQAYSALLRAAREKRLDETQLEASYMRISELKRRYAGT